MSSYSYAISGSAIGNEVLSARSAGQGYVGTAGQSNDPSVAYSNPSALTKLPGTNVSAGLHWENLNGKYEGSAGRSSEMRAANAIVPNVSLSQSLMDGRIGTGLTVQSPFGLETHWPGEGPLRYVATNSKVHLTVITPAVAYKVTDKISAGVGVSYVNVFDAELERHVSNDALNTGIAVQGGLPLLPSGQPDANSRLSGTGASWGYHAGLLLEPNDKNSIGITYHSKVKLHINGTAALTGLSGYAASGLVFGGADYQTSAYTDLFLPQNLQLGYAYKPTDKWMLELDAAWYDWSPNRDLNVRFAESDPTRRTLLNTGNPMPSNWRNSWSFAGGVNHKTTDRLELRGGLWYVPWTVPESAFNPAIADASRFGISTGFGFQLTSSLSVDAAYSAVFFHNRHVNNTLGSSMTGIASYDINGVYKNFANLVALNLTYRLGASK
jgi:long-chain fatty acid transport protein